jgi:hypothetical protein
MKVNRILVLAAASVLVAVPLAWAQMAAPPTPAAPALPAATPWLAIVYALFAAAAICVLGFKSGHRTHLD